MGKQDGRDRTVTTGAIDDSSATILHMDLDAFFASVELLARPELVGLPVIVGHRSARSVVTAATYEARTFGVNSAMPMAIALRRCPNAVVLEPHFDRYLHYSRQVMQICHELTPRVERLGIDEAFLDVAGARAVFGSPMAVAERLRSRVRAETGLVCSVGAAASKFVAKLASGRAKPDGLLVVPESETLSFLHPLSIAALWGVGAKTEELLRSRGIDTVGALARTPVNELSPVLGDGSAERLHELAWGRDDRAVLPRTEEKSVGHEHTFEADVTDATVLRAELLRMSNAVAKRLRDARVVGRTIVLRLRFSDFSTITRSRTLREPTDLGRIVYEEACVSLAGALRPGASIRLIGVRVEQFMPRAAAPLGLWDDSANWRGVEEVMDAAGLRFGTGSVTPARLVGRDRQHRPRLGQRD